MNIALICDMEKKESTIQFCKRYENILMYNKIYLPEDLKDDLDKIINLKYFETLYCDENAKEQIFTRIFYEEIDIFLFFRTPKEFKHKNKIDFDLLNLCDSLSLPYATNFKTAEILLENLI